MEHNAMKEIQLIYGMDEFKSLALKLKRVADNQKKLGGTRIQLPNYLFAVAPGCGVTTRIRQLTRLLDELHLIHFEGDRKYFEWVLDASAFENGGSFDRLLDQVQFMAGFRRNFYGVIGLDVEAWVGRADSPKLSRLMDFAEDMIGQIMIVFVVNQHSIKELTEITRRISQATPLEVIHIDLPKTNELVKCLSDFLKKRGFVVQPSAKKYFSSIMPDLAKANQFDGFQTLSNLADEIVYRYCSGERADSVYLAESDVSFIGEPGGYLERFRGHNAGKRGSERRIGFDSGRDL